MQTARGEILDQLRGRQVAVIGLLLALVPVLFFSGGRSYISRLFTLMLLFMILAVALNVAYGHGDVLFLCLGALSAIGAYTTLITAQALGLSLWMTIWPSALAVGVIGAVISYAASRRRFTLGISAIVTLAVQLSVMQILIGLDDVTGGSTGKPFSGLGLAGVADAVGIASATVLYYFLLVALLAVLLFYNWLMSSRYGLAFEMLRQDKTSSETSGINVVKYQTLGGFVLGAIVGFVGPFFGQMNGILLPGMYTFLAIDVTVLIILILGGLRTMAGPVLTAPFIIFVEDFFSSFGTWRAVVFGTMLIVMFLYFRQGIVPFLAEQLRARFDSVPLVST